jgi:hypothetical protein
LRSYLDFIGARRKRGQIELTRGVRYGREDFSIGDLAHLYAGARYDGSGLVFYRAGDLGMAIEGAAIMLCLQVDGTLVCAGIRRDGAGLDLDINPEVIGGIELLIGARALDEVIAGLAAIPRNGLRTKLRSPGVSRLRTVGDVREHLDRVEVLGILLVSAAELGCEPADLG